MVCPVLVIIKVNNFDDYRANLNAGVNRSSAVINVYPNESDSTCSERDILVLRPADDSFKEKAIIQLFMQPCLQALAFGGKWLHLAQSHNDSLVVNVQRFKLEQRCSLQMNRNSGSAFHDSINLRTCSHGAN